MLTMIQPVEVCSRIRRTLFLKKCRLPPFLLPAAHVHRYEQSRLHSFMNSIGESCNEIKKQYDTCFQTWFSDKFLKGDTNDSIIIMEACNQLKKNYDECFNSWFTEKFLKGNTDDSSCRALLDVYKECVQKAIKDHKIEIKDLEVSVLETEKEKQPPS